MAVWIRVVVTVMKRNEPFQANILKAEACGVSDSLHEAWWERMIRKKNLERFPSPPLEE